MARDKQLADEAPGQPIASVPIPGTGWHVVWTADHKYFFFNPTSKTSIWDRPAELQKNPKINEIIKAGPDAKKSEGK